MESSSNDNAFTTLFQHAKLGIIIVNHEGYMQLANPFAATLFGYQTDELIGKPVHIACAAGIAAKTCRRVC